ncbi:MAG: hypothetical protein JXB03_08510 [Spirochaetales bacterium]|nr:hypothetical protein [Spirochaetales bacterium]
MNQNFRIIDVCVAEITRDHDTFLGCKVSNSSKPDTFALEKQVDAPRGYIVHEKKVNDVELKGMAENQGRYLLLPYKGVSTLTHLLGKEKREALSHLQHLVRAVKTLYDATGTIPRMHTNSVFFLPAGEVVFLAHDTLERFRSCHRETERLSVFDLYNDHQRSDVSNFSFSFAAYLYQVLTGSAPFTGESIGRVQHRIAKGRFIPLKFVVPHINRNLASTIDQCLSGKQIDPGDWDRLLSDLETAGCEEEIAEEERLQLLAKGENLRQKTLTVEKWESFFRKYRFSLAVAGMILIFLGSFAYSIISKALEPPVTVGMQPEEVVQLFYDSMNSFDHFSMEDTITKEAGRGYINEAVNVYAFAKMRQAYEPGTTPFVDVQEWVDAGRPLLPAGSSVYGIANLHILPESETSFLCTYEKWTDNESDTDGTSQVEPYRGERITERLFLEFRNDAWIITGVEPVSRIPLTAAIEQD